ncbi:MAG TPA: signal peptidase I [Mycobacteriales bacterium]|nr:signal peptidase I [Mycobacteriales bacterium]
MSEDEPVAVATDDDGSPAESTTEEKHRPFWKELPILIIIALALAVLIKTFFVQAFYIPSASMENTLQGGNPSCNDCGTSPGHPFDRVLVDKLIYDFRSPHRGEIVVFKGPAGWPPENQSTTPSNPILRVIHDVGTWIGLTPSSSDNDFIKRVIGVGGDTVACSTSDVLSVNGHPLTEPYLYPGSDQCSSLGFAGHSVVVPKGQLFVMGDHRDDSSDSRANGTVPVSDVVGKASFVIWPISDWKHLGVPATFHQPGLDAGVATGLSGALLVPWRRLRRRRLSSK